MAASGGANDTSKDLDNDDAQASQPSSYYSFTPASTIDERQSKITSSGGRSSSSHDRRRPFFSDISEPTPESERSVVSTQSQPLPTPAVTGYEDVDVDAMAYDPQDLLQEGLAEWRDRAASLLTLKRSSSIAAAKGYRGLEQKPSFKFERQQSARRSHESYEGTESTSLEAVQGSSKSGYSAGKSYSIFKFRVTLKGFQ